MSRLDDGFLLYDGTSNVRRRAGFYWVSRTAFDGWGMIRVNSDPVRGDIFVLRSTTDKHSFTTTTSRSISAH